MVGGSHWSWVVCQSGSNGSFEESCKKQYLDNLAAVCTPVVTMAPDAILVPVEDTDLAVDGARRAPVAVAVEGDGLHQVLVPVPDQVEVGALVHHRRAAQVGAHAGHFDVVPGCTLFCDTTLLSSSDVIYEGGGEFESFGRSLPLRRNETAVGATSRPPPPTPPPPGGFPLFLFGCRVSNKHQKLHVNSYY